MRNLLLASTLTLLATTGCNESPGALPEPPVLRVTSPQRSLIRDGAGALEVTGTVEPSIDGSPVKKVMVNGVAASVSADGSFNATLNLTPGATLITTTAESSNGGKASDTRSVEAGQLRAPGSNIENAVTTAISKEAFAKIAGAAGTMIKAMDFKPMLTPLNPIAHTGDEGGEDCLFARGYVDDFKMSNATITLVPVVGGLSMAVKLDGVDVPGRARYAVACLNGSSTLRVQASSVLVKGTLMITPDGMMGFKTDLKNETVQITGLNISASGIPGAVLDMLPLESLIEKAAPIAAKLFMGPMMNKALGGLGGPKELNVLGKTIAMQVVPSDIMFDAEGGLITLDMKMLIKGTESSKGFIFTDNGIPTMDPGQGLMIGLADDLANSMVSQLVATGMLNLSLPAHGGTFDKTEIAMTSPPMISADPADGKMKLILPDMKATFTLAGTPVGRAYINAVVDLKITPALNGYGVAIELGKPTIHANADESEIPNQTLMTNEDLGTAVELVLDSQIHSISALLGSIPLPAMPAGIVMTNMSVTSDDGYVMVKGTLQ
jgi:hypothetical protein